jgi:hypothetical protein
VNENTRIRSVPNWNSPVNRRVLRNLRSYLLGGGEGERTLATKWLGEEDFSREYVVRWSLNPDSTMMFFFVSGRPNLRRNVLELISAKLVNEEEGGHHRCFEVCRRQDFGALKIEHGCPSSSISVSALEDG